jgi:NAD-dependent SIR2 family protein deacetylase
MENRLDGNAADGLLHAIFPFEMTMAQATCVGCGQTTVMGELMVYKHGMGTIVRCPACDTALIRMAESKGRYWLDARGVSVLQIPVES